MSDFSVTPLRTNTIAYVDRMRDVIELEPAYQRQGEVWSKGKQRLLIDSIINQFDIPKIYFHQPPIPIIIDGRRVKYSLVDGRQRLEAIWDFIDGRIALSEDFVVLETGSTTPAGMTYSELRESEPDLASLFGASPLDIMVIHTDDIELIEEMFSRLNEAVPLNAAEKRNGRGGPLRSAVRTICSTTFFTDRLPFDNRRYRQYDVATKFLYLASRGGPADIKKRQLDDFWEEFRKNGQDTEAEGIADTVLEVLAHMESTFEARDRLLTSVGMVSLYFLLYLDIVNSSERRPRRDDLVAFNGVRRLNRFNDEEDLSGQQRRLLEFDRLSQSPNDEGALDFRLGVLKDFLRNPSDFA